MRKKPDVNVISAIMIATLSLMVAPSNANPSEMTLAPKVVPLTSENIKETISGNAEKTLILNFWAPWCPPCKAMTPILSKLASETPNTVFGRVDVQSQPDLASEYGISGIPVTYVMRDQKIVKKFNGFVSESELKTALGEE